MATTAASLTLCLAVCGANVSTKIPEERVDLIEINHFHDDQGRPVFDQIIFYDWSPLDRRYQIRDWRLLKNPNQVPLRTAREGEYVAVWTDFKSRDAIRKTQAKLLRESWTQYDPELVEREFLPEGKRRKLREMPVATRNGEGTPADRSIANTARLPDPAATLTPLQTPIRR
ncbi:MAG: hypothetical protein ACKV0T_27040 [Planctomycetales bacterium]